MIKILWGHWYKHMNEHDSFSAKIWKIKRVKIFRTSYGKSDSSHSWSQVLLVSARRCSSTISNGNIQVSSLIVYLIPQETAEATKLITKTTISSTMKKWTAYWKEMSSSNTWREITITSMEWASGRFRSSLGRRRFLFWSLTLKVWRNLLLSIRSATLCLCFHQVLMSCRKDWKKEKLKAPELSLLGLRTQGKKWTRFSMMTKRPS